MQPGTFSVIFRSRPDSVVVAELFSMISISGPDSVGGGVVAEMFVVSSGGPDSVGGGSGRTFFPVAAGKDQSTSLNSGRFFLHFRGTCRSPAISRYSCKSRETCQVCLHKERNSINSLEKNHLPKVWGAHGPRGPPGYAAVGE